MDVARSGFGRTVQYFYQHLYLGWVLYYVWSESDLVFPITSCFAFPLRSKRTLLMKHLFSRFRAPFFTLAVAGLAFWLPVGSAQAQAGGGGGGAGKVSLQDLHFIAKAGEVVSGDFDADGDPDVAIDDVANGLIRFSENTGGRLSASALTLGVPRLRMMRVRDDSRLVALYGGTPGTAAAPGLRVFKGNAASGGWTGFSLEQDLALPAELVGIGQGDFDGDGDLDLIGYTAASDLYLIQHDVSGGGPTGPATHSYSVQSLPVTGGSISGPIVEVLFGNLDGSGAQQVTMVCSGVFKSFYRCYTIHGTGRGVLGGAGVSLDIISSQLLPHVPTDATLGDVDNDGDLDLALAYSGGIEVSYNTTGLLATPVEVIPFQGGVRVATGDVNGDGLTDVMGFSDITGAVVVRKGNPPPPPPTPTPPPPPPPSRDIVEPNEDFGIPTDMLLVNLDADSELEAVLSCRKTGGDGVVATLDYRLVAAVISSTPAPNTSVPVPPTGGLPLTMTFDRPPTLPAGPNTLTVRDEGTAAGQPLSISNGGTGSTNATLPALPARTYTAIWTPATTGLPTGATPAVPYSWRFRTTPVATDGSLGAGVALPTVVGTETLSSATADLDGDGLIDLITSTQTTGPSPTYALHFFRNLGNGQYAPAVSSALNRKVPKILITMTDGAQNKIACCQQPVPGGPDEVVAFEYSAASGGLVLRNTYTTPISGITDMVAADLNLDGTDELLLLSPSTGKIVELRMNGASSHTVVYDAAVNAASVRMLTVYRLKLRVQDVDWMPISGGPNDPVQVVEIDAASGLATITSHGNGLTGAGAQFADITGDGILDLVCVNANGISYKAGTADGDFGPVQTRGAGQLGTGFTPKELHLEDMDGDGALDFIINCDVSPVLPSPGGVPLGELVRMNNAGVLMGKMGPILHVAIGSTIASISVHDVDNDGDHDVVAFGNEGGSVYRNGADDFPDLTITGTATVPGGNFRHIVVEGPLGDATLDFSAVPPTTFETFTGKGHTKVRMNNNARRPAVGGAVPPISPSTGAARVESHFRYGYYNLKAGATLYVSNPSGIAADGSTLNPAAREPMGLQLSDSAHYVYDGATAQVTGAGLPTTVQSLTCANPTSLTLSRQVSVREKAVVSTGRLASNGLLTALSNAQGTAFIADTGGFVTGNVRLQNRVRPLAAAGFRQLTAPVTNTTVADLSVGASTTAAGFRPVVNAAYNTSSTPLAVRPYPSVFGFDESRAPASADFGLGWFSPASLSSPLTFGRGYSVLMPANLTYDVVGQLRQTPTVTIGPLTRTGNFTGNTEKSGWHLVGNPFATPLDWDLVTIPAGLSPSISVWVSTGGSTGAYRTRANGLGSLTDGILPVHQAFFCRVTGTTASLTLDKGGLYCGTTDHFRPAPETRPVLTMHLQAPVASADATAETSVYFADGAALGLDATHDGTRPGRNVGVPTLAVLVEGEELAIDGRPLTALATGTRADLLLDLPMAGTYELRVGQLLNLAGQKVEVLDQLTGTRYDLTQQPVVRFTAVAGEVRGRFSLHFSPANGPLGNASALAAPSALTLWPNPAHATTYLGGALPLTPVRVFDSLGREVLHLTTDATGAAILPIATLAPGVYSVRAGDAARRLVVE